MNDLALTLPDDFIRAVADRVRDQLHDERTTWMNVASAAEHLDMSEARLRQITSGRNETVEPIPHYRDGRHFVYVREELDGWRRRGGSELA